MNADCSEEYPVRAEHDNLEKILAAMLQMEPSCRDHFRANQVRKYKEQDRILAAMLQIKSPLAEIILENFAWEDNYYERFSSEPIYYTVCTVDILLRN